MECVRAVRSAAWQEPWWPNICVIATESQIEVLKKKKDAIVPGFAVDEPNCRQSKTQNK